MRLNADNARFTSGPVSVNEASAATIDVDLTDGKSLFLVIELASNNAGLRGLWRDARFVFADGHEQSLADLKWTAADATWDSTSVKKDATGKAIGISAQPPAVAQYAIPDPSKRYD